LVEVLVVISIIGILASIVVAGLTSVQMRTRDTRRIADLKQIQIASELFYDANGYYPQSNCGWDCNEYRYSYDNSWDSFAADLAPYIGTLPKDPVNSNCGPWYDNCYSYVYGNVRRNTQREQYDLTAQLKHQNHPQRCGLRE